MLLSFQASQGIKYLTWHFGRWVLQATTDFFGALHTVEARSLQLTKEVLTERQHLEVCLEGLQPQIQAGLAEKSKLEKTKLEAEAT